MASESGTGSSNCVTRIIYIVTRHIAFNELAFLSTKNPLQKKTKKPQESDKFPVITMDACHTTWNGASHPRGCDQPWLGTALLPRGEEPGAAWA